MKQNRKTELFVWLGAVLIGGLAFTALKTPLSEVHWDTPFYLYKAKLLVDTPLYSGYAKHAYQIAHEVTDKTWDKELSYFPQAYWYFTRLGHLTTLAAFVGLAEKGRYGLLCAHWGFGVLLTLSLVFLVLLTIELGGFFSTDREYMVRGTCISALLWMASGQGWHMVGNLVTEVSALFFLSVAMVAYLTSQVTRSWWLAALAGAATFAVYATRTDFVWVPLTFGALIFFFRRPHGRLPWWGPGSAMAAAVAFGLYGLYAWTFYPLADPRVFVQFAGIVQHAYDDSPSRFFRLWIVSGSLLWVGVLLAIFQFRKHSLVRLGLIWLFLLGIPWIVELLRSGPVQTRMFLSMFPAVLLLSSVGWAVSLEQAFSLDAGFRRLGVAALAVTLLLGISRETSYAMFRSIPGAWRLQYLRTYLVPDKYERRTYPADNLARISDALYHASERKLVVISSSAARDLEYVDLIRFFGPPFASDLDFYTPESQKVWRRGIEPRDDSEPVAFRSYAKDDDLIALRSRKYELFFLTKSPQHDIPEYACCSVEVLPIVSDGSYLLWEATGPK